MTVQISNIWVYTINEYLTELVVERSTKDDVVSWCNKYMNSSDLCSFNYVETKDGKLDGLLATEPVYGNNDGAEGLYPTSWIKFNIYKFTELEPEPTDTPVPTDSPLPTDQPEPTSSTDPSPDPVPSTPVETGNTESGE